MYQLKHGMYDMARYNTKYANEDFFKKDLEDLGL